MVKMDFKLKGITWVGNFYQKFEEVCHEVDDIVGQDAVKYLGSQVQNVGDSVKRFYSDVVQEVLPLPPLVNSVKHKYRSVALNNKVDSPLELTASVTENKKGAKESPVNNFIESSNDADVNNLPNNQHSQASIGLDLENQVSDEISSNSHEVEDSHSTQEEVRDDSSRETSGIINQNLHVGIEQNAVKSAPQLLNLMSLNEIEPIESSISSESLSGSYDSGYGALAGSDKNIDVTWVQNSCTMVEENTMKSSTSEVLKLKFHSRQELLDASLSDEHFDGDDEISCGTPDEVSPATSISNMKSQSSPEAGSVNYNIAMRDQCSYGSESSGSLTSSEVSCFTVPSERPMMNVEPLCFKSSFFSESDSLSTNSPGSYCFDADSCKETSVDVAGSTLDCSMVLVSYATTPDVSVAGQFKTSQAGLLSCRGGQSMESNERDTCELDEVMSLNNLSGIKHGQISSAQDRAIVSLSEIDESLVISLESSKEDIQLSDDVKLEESCIFVDDSELHAVSCRVRRRSYKKRIKDAFAPKKRLEKEYEQLAIWYGDSDMESSEGTSQTVVPLSFRRSLDSKNLQVQHLSEPEWELL